MPTRGRLPEFKKKPQKYLIQRFFNKNCNYDLNDVTIFTAITINIIVMKKTKLGEFEELVLLTVATLQKMAYGVEIKRELEQRLNETLSVGSIQSALKRMEEKGFLTSEFGEATLKRGGKRKRIYSATPYAHKVLAELKEIRAGLWNAMPALTHSLKAI
jgi:PadR family transcriptional regulator PadR